jgi:glutathione S-transferase
MADSKRGAAMIVVHHVNNSRSQRILWLLKELGLPYEIKFYKRHAQTNGAVEELKAVLREPQLSVRH